MIYIELFVSSFQQIGSFAVAFAAPNYPNRSLTLEHTPSEKRKWVFVVTK